MATGEHPTLTLSLTPTHSLPHHHHHLLLLLHHLLLLLLLLAPTASAADPEDISLYLTADGSGVNSVVRQWGVTFNSLRPQTAVDYRVSTRNETLSMVAGGETMFGVLDGGVVGSDAVDVQPGTQLLQVPIYATPIVPVYNIPSLPRAHPGSSSLRLSHDSLLGIFSGSIVNWQDASIVSENPSLTLPNSAIALVVTDFASSLTFHFTRGLELLNGDAQAVNQWPYGQVNVWPNVTNPNVLFAENEAEMLSLLASTPNSISYSTYPSAVSASLSFTPLSPDGLVYIDTPLEITSSLEAVTLAPTTLSGEISPSPTAWPLAYFTYYVYSSPLVDDGSKSASECEERKTLFRYLRWSITHPYTSQNQALFAGHAPLLPALLHSSVSRLEEESCGGELLLREIKEVQHVGFGFNLVLGLSIFGMLVSIALGVLLLWFPQPIISRLLTVLHLFGAVSNFSGILWWYLVPTEDWICSLRAWFGFFGYSIQLSSIFTKTWLFYRIFSSLSNAKHLKIASFNVKNNIIATIGLSIVSQSVILICWAVIDPYSSRILFTDEIDRRFIYECYSDYGYIWIGLETLYFLFILIWGIFIVYKTWNMKETLFESRWILMSIYNLIIAITLILSLISLKADEDFVFFVFTIPVFVTTFLTMVSVSVPKLYQMFKLLYGTRDQTEEGGEDTDPNPKAGGGFRERLRQSNPFSKDNNIIHRSDDSVSTGEIPMKPRPARFEDTSSSRVTDPSSSDGMPLRRAPTLKQSQIYDVGIASSSSTSSRSRNPKPRQGKNQMNEMKGKSKGKGKGHGDDSSPKQSSSSTASSSMSGELDANNYGVMISSSGLTDSSSFHGVETAGEGGYIDDNQLSSASSSTSSEVVGGTGYVIMESASMSSDSPSGGPDKAPEGETRLSKKESAKQKKAAKKAKKANQLQKRLSKKSARGEEKDAGKVKEGGTTSKLQNDERSSNDSPSSAPAETRGRKASILQNAYLDDDILSSSSSSTSSSSASSSVAEAASSLYLDDALSTYSSSGSASASVSLTTAPSTQTKPNSATTMREREKGKEKETETGTETALPVTPPQSSYLDDDLYSSLSSSGADDHGEEAPRGEGEANREGGGGGKGRRDLMVSGGDDPFLDASGGTDALQERMKLMLGNRKLPVTAALSQSQHESKKLSNYYVPMESSSESGKVTDSEGHADSLTADAEEMRKKKEKRHTQLEQQRAESRSPPALSPASPMLRQSTLSRSVSESSSSDEIGAQIEDILSNLVRDWNTEFQDLLNLPDSITKFVKLRQLAADFSYCARTYGRIIISELYVDDQQKTIAPLSIGGVAGGSKYIVSGILFKFATCSSDLMTALYGGDEWSAKASAAELRGLSSIFDCEVDQVHVPLLTIIDYMGFRLTAISLLPISGRKTLRYGSPDAARTVYNDLPSDLHSRVVKICNILNLKGHHVGRNEATLMHGPVDIEGHRAYDGLFYVVDTARMHPPEAPYLPPSRSPERPGLHLWRFLRPEFVKAYSKPLSSDAFSAFYNPAYKAERRADNKEVQEATLHLYDVVVPLYVREELLVPAVLGGTVESVSKYFQAPVLHRRGINVRMLGRVRNILRQQTPRNHNLETACLIQIIARVLKNLLRNRLRLKMNEVKAASQEAYLDIVQTFFNFIIGNEPSLANQVKVFWSKKVNPEIQSRFNFALSKEEMSSHYNLHSVIVPHMELMLHSLSTYTNIFLSPRAMREFRLNPTAYVALGTDFQEMTPKVKQLNIVFRAQGAALLLQASRARNAAEEDRLLLLGNDAFSQAVVSTTNPFSTLRQWGDLLFLIALNHEELRSKKIEIFQMAINKYDDALRTEPNHAVVNRQLGLVYGHWASLTTSVVRKADNFKLAGTLIKKAYSIDPQCLDEIIAQALKQQRMELCILLRIFAEIIFESKRELSTSEKLRTKKEIRNDLNATAERVRLLKSSKERALNHASSDPSSIRSPQAEEAAPDSQVHNSSPAINVASFIKVSKHKKGRKTPTSSPTVSPNASRRRVPTISVAASSPRVGGLDSPPRSPPQSRAVLPPIASGAEEASASGYAGSGSASGGATAGSSGGGGRGGGLGDSVGGIGTDAHGYDTELMRRSGGGGGGNGGSGGGGGGVGGLNGSGFMGVGQGIASTSTEQASNNNSAFSASSFRGITKNIRNVGNVFQSNKRESNGSSVAQRPEETLTSVPLGSLLERVRTEKSISLSTLKLADLGSSVLTDESLILALSIAGEELRRLSIGGCHLLTGVTLNYLQQLCPNIYKLAIHETAFDLKQLSQYFKFSPGLRKVAVSEASGLQKVLRKQLPDCHCRVIRREDYVSNLFSDAASGANPSHSKTENALTKMVIKAHLSGDFESTKSELAGIIDRNILTLGPSALLAGVDDLNAKKRSERLMAFSLLHPSNMKSSHIKTLIEICDDPADSVRIWAVICLGRVGTTAAVKPLYKKAKGEHNASVKEAMTSVIARHSATQAGLFMESDFRKRVHKHDSAGKAKFPTKRERKHSRRQLRDHSPQASSIFGNNASGGVSGLSAPLGESDTSTGLGPASPRFTFS